MTVDDCIKFLPNRFELTLAATNRARQIALGATPVVEANKDKPTVIALREIAGGKVGKELLNPPSPTAPVLQSFRAAFAAFANDARARPAVGCLGPRRSGSVAPRAR